MIYKKCAHVGCNKLISVKETYCVKHQADEKKASQWSYAYRKKYYSRFQNFYKSKEWRKLSEIHRIEEPFCRDCLKRGIYTPAQVADHIKPLATKDGWKHRLDDDNLQSLCTACHNRKTRELDQELFEVKKVVNRKN